MMRTILVPAALAALLALATSSPVHAYGACSRSATYTNPNTGRSRTVNENTSYGPNGVSHNVSESGSGPNGSYSESASRSYSPTMYGGYTGAGVERGYSASVVRYP